MFDAEMIALRRIDPILALSFASLPSMIDYFAKAKKWAERAYDGPHGRDGMAFGMRKKW